MVSSTHSGRAVDMVSRSRPCWSQNEGPERRSKQDRHAAASLPVWDRFFGDGHEIVCVPRFSLTSGEDPPCFASSSRHYRAMKAEAPHTLTPIPGRGDSACPVSLWEGWDEGFPDQRCRPDSRSTQIALMEYPLKKITL